MALTNIYAKAFNIRNDEVDSTTVNQPMAMTRTKKGIDTDQYSCGIRPVSIYSSVSANV